MVDLIQGPYTIHCQGTDTPSTPEGDCHVEEDRVCDFLVSRFPTWKASRIFYVESVGLTPVLKSLRSDAEGGMVFDTRPIPFANPAVRWCDLSRRPMADWAGVSPSPWFACDDALRACTRKVVAARGGNSSPPGDGPFGRFFVFRDPDGYTPFRSSSGDAAATFAKTQVFIKPYDYSLDLIQRDLITTAVIRASSSLGWRNWRCAFNELPRRCAAEFIAKKHRD